MCDYTIYIWYLVYTSTSICVMRRRLFVCTNICIWCPDYTENSYKTISGNGMEYNTNDSVALLRLGLVECSFIRVLYDDAFLNYPQG